MPQFEHLLLTVQTMGALGALVFIPLYILGTLLFIPIAVLMPVAGALFGLPLGFTLVSIASLMSAGCVFLSGRHLSRKWILKKIGSNPKIHALDEALASGGWKVVLLARLSTILPFSVMNYAFGLSKIRFKHYMFATWIGMMPSVLMYVYLGSFTKEIVLDGGHSKKTPAEWALFILGIAMTLGITLYATFFIKNILRIQEKVEK